MSLVSSSKNLKCNCKGQKIQMKTAMVTLIHPSLPQTLQRFRKSDPEYSTE